MNTYLHAHLYFADTGRIHRVLYEIRAKVEETVNDMNKRIRNNQLQIPSFRVHYLGVYEIDYYRL